MIRRLLIANRGEIAVRIIRACRELGVETVAVYSEADRDSRHAALADFALPIGPAPAADSYLVVSRHLDAARRAGATRSIRATAFSRRTRALPPRASRRD